MEFFFHSPTYGQWGDRRQNFVCGSLNHLLIELLEFLRLMKAGRLFLSILGDITYTRE